LTIVFNRFKVCSFRNHLFSILWLKQTNKKEKKMKKMILIISFMLIIPNLIMATSMNIAASDGMLNAVIGADTLADGSQAHDEYRLVTTAETYKFAGTLTVSGNITITGVHNPSSGRISCIQPAVLSDGSIPGTMLVMTGDNTKGMLKDLYLLAVATNNTASGAGVAVEVKGDSSNLYVDHCVFDGWQTFAIAYNGQWDSFFITNSHFRNMVHPNQHYIGEVLRNTWPGEAYTDSVVMTNNVMLAVNGYAAAPVTKWYQTYFEFSYNKVLYTFKNPFFIFNVTDAKINNNWFYGAYSGGVAGGENPWWDVLWNADADGTFGVIALNQLSPANGAMFDANYDSTNAAATEALRMVEVKNNVYYWPSGVTDHWAAASAAGTIIDIDTDSDGTADSNLFVAPQWMDNQTMAMFNDDAAYPNLDMSNNVNADPGFMTSLDADILNGSGGADVGLLSWFDEIRGATATTNVCNLSIRIAPDICCSTSTSYLIKPRKKTNIGSTATIENICIKTRHKSRISVNVVGHIQIRVCSIIVKHCHCLIVHPLWSNK
jgi:hypothetical protein